MNQFDDVTEKDRNEALEEDAFKNKRERQREKEEEKAGRGEDPVEVKVSLCWTELNVKARVLRPTSIDDYPEIVRLDLWAVDDSRVWEDELKEVDLNRVENEVLMKWGDDESWKDPK
jgi:hypothetical protein